jgi:hypothetical protein
MKQLEDIEKKYIANENKDLLLNTELKCSVDTSSPEYKKELAYKKERIPCKICESKVSRAHMARHQATAKKCLKKAKGIKKPGIKVDEQRCDICQKTVKKKNFDKHKQSQTHINLSKIK